MDTYKSETVQIDGRSGITPGECESLIGQTVVHITEDGDTFTVEFSDGSTLILRALGFGDSGLVIEVVRAA